MTQEKKKEKILTDLYNSGTVQFEIEKICTRNKIKKDTFINEDIVQETFYHLSKTKPETLIKIHQQGERNLLSFAITIAIRKGVSKHPKFPDYYKHSLASNILFASNLNTKQTLCDTDEIDNEKHSAFKHLLANPLQNNSEDDLWELIRENLSKTENSFLNSLLYIKKKRGKYKDSVIQKRKKLFEKIRIIIEKNKININGKTNPF